MSHIKKMLKNEQGATIVIFALMLTVLLGFGSLVVDIGKVEYEKVNLENAVDAAALAAAQELIGNGDNADNVAIEYLQKYDIDPNEAEVDLIGHNAISVRATREVNYTLARVLGFESGDVTVKAVAGFASLSGMNIGIRPFAIADQNLEYGITYILKNGGGNGVTGNYGAIALGGNGASNYKDNIINGYNGHLQVGDYVDTEPGNMSGPTSQGINALLDECDHDPECTFDNHDPDCPKIITVLVVETLDVNGRKQVKIVGFASFFLEGVQGQGNESIVTGKFIETLGKGDLSENQTDYGIRGIKLFSSEYEGAPEPTPRILPTETPAESPDPTPTSTSTPGATPTPAQTPSPLPTPMTPSAPSISIADGNGNDKDDITVSGAQSGATIKLYQSSGNSDGNYGSTPYMTCTGSSFTFDDVADNHYYKATQTVDGVESSCSPSVHAVK